jgi:pimeloyl-ACP methyl ester carboxylesterase
MTDQLARGGAERVRLDVDGRHIAALQAGPADGRPVLMVPGYTGSKEDFAPILDPIAACGFRVMAIDLPGQHESPGPTELTDYSTEQLGALVATLCSTLGPRVHLLGHSFGGLVARAAAIAAPARFASLVLLSSGPARIGGPRRLRIEQMQPVLASSGLPGVYAAMQALAEGTPGYAAPPDELAEFLERRFVGGSPTMLRGMGDALRHEPDRVAELAATELPVLVIHGVDDDAWPPAEQQDMAERLGARYVVIPGAAHSAAVENPSATIDALLEFWRLT